MIPDFNTNNRPHFHTIAWLTKHSTIEFCRYVICKSITCYFYLINEATEYQRVLMFKITRGASRRGNGSLGLPMVNCSAFRNLLNFQDFPSIQLTSCMSSLKINHDFWNPLLRLLNMLLELQVKSAVID